MIHYRLFGAAHLDRIGQTKDRAALGQSNPGTMREAPGGAALNVASVFAALGARVTLNSAVGADAAGVRVQAEITSRGIEFGLLASELGHATAIYTAILDADGELITALSDMQIYAGVTVGGELTSAEDWVHVDTNLLQGVIGTVLAQTAAHRSAMTVSAAKAPRLREHLSALDLLFTNRTEAAALCDVPTETRPRDLAAELAKRGSRRAIITDGSAPIGLLDAGAVTEISIPPCAVKSVTGAGDALTAATLFALGRGEPLAAAIQLGIQAAQATLAVDGPYRADLAQVIGVST